MRRGQPSGSARRAGCRVTEPAGGPLQRWAKVLDQSRCIGCHACTTACKSENEVPIGVTRTYVKSVEIGIFPQVRRAFQVTRWFGDAFRERHPDIVKSSVDVFLRNDVKAYAESCRMLGAADARKDLPRLAMPAAIAVGEEDYATPPAMAEALHRGLKNSTLTIIEGGRHLTPLEMPDRIDESLGALLKAASPR